LHSGSYGGVAENPAVILSRIITQLKDISGKILIPGFYDNVVKPTKNELSDFSKIKTSKKLLKEEGEFFKVGGGEEKFSLNERRWTRPTLDINGLTSGYQGDGSKTIIPAKASAKISMRLVPNQDPKKIANLFKKYVKDITPKDVVLNITEHSGAYPYKAPTTDPVFDIAKESLTEVFGNKTVFNGVGGSIGFVPIVAQKLKVPCVMIGYGLPTDNIHAPNEHILLDNFLGGIRATAGLLEKIPTIYVKK
jgi:acetylornithine deacetylase/succinyl-diaminopimelate desuccinylase-like protein